MPTLALQGIRGDSAGNYQLIDEETIEGMVKLLEIPSSWRNLYLKTEDYCQKLQAHGRGNN
jgi:hypothetical protein